ncbi:SDR family oxidoreductase [Polyangium spumosum]|uniref:SDR family oxidoreductase n=1 Tax=Polyangium spumosum TaxID=889282 RepID=A0A6N7PEE6_9BACT|nr:SDR family oxidoreductase [Polyangium spumosum]MRG90433.1 SDR family oxidoreductase [Polyangium spumosum]
MMNPTALFDVRGEVALVTGGSGVLGAMFCRTLAAAGARVAVMGRRLDPCEALAHSIRADGGDALAVSCDVLDTEALKAAARDVEATLGPVTILVNGAGGNHPKGTTGPDRSLFELDPAAFGEVFDLNVQGTLRPCQVFGRGMAERGRGSIVNITSLSADRPLTRVAAYSAAKAAVVNLTRWLAVHMAQSYGPNIRVNALAPGFFLTEQNRFLLTDHDTGALTERGRSIHSHTPMARMGAPEDLSGALLFLASSASAFVTGIVLPVDGGFSAQSGV